MDRCLYNYEFEWVLIVMGSLHIDWLGVHCKYLEEIRYIRFLLYFSFIKSNFFCPDWSDTKAGNVSAFVGIFQFSEVRIVQETSALLWISPPYNYIIIIYFCQLLLDFRPEFKFLIPVWWGKLHQSIFQWRIFLIGNCTSE